MTDAIQTINDLIAHQPDGSPLTPKLREVVAEIERMRSENVAIQADKNDTATELATLRAEHAKLRELAGAVSDGPGLREIKQGQQSRDAQTKVGG